MPFQFLQSMTSDSPASMGVAGADLPQGGHVAPDEHVALGEALFQHGVTPVIVQRTVYLVSGVLQVAI